jgi:hypothetical protein
VVLKRRSLTARSEIDFVDDCPILDEVVHSGHAVQSAEAALLLAALFDLGVDNRPVVNPDRASLYLSRNSERAVDVRGPNRRGEAVLRVVRESDGFFFAVEGLHNQDRPEHLLLCDRHGMVADLEERGPVECAPRQRPVLERAASQHNLGATGDCRVDHTVNALDIGDI